MPSSAALVATREVCWFAQLATTMADAMATLAALTNARMEGSSS
jgi:hypothetical protein